MRIRLTDIAEVIRSKNAGPYQLTLDIIFKESDTFLKVCKAKVINKKLITGLYGVTEDKVINIFEFKPAKAIKVTLARTIPSGSLGDTDVYGAQQHAPLLALELYI